LQVVEFHRDGLVRGTVDLCPLGTPSRKHQPGCSQNLQAEAVADAVKTFAHLTDALGALLFLSSSIRHARHHQHRLLSIAFQNSGGNILGRTLGQNRKTVQQRVGLTPWPMRSRGFSHAQFIYVIL